MLNPNRSSVRIGPSLILFGIMLLFVVLIGLWGLYMYWYTENEKQKRRREIKQEFKTLASWIEREKAQQAKLVENSSNLESLQTVYETTTNELMKQWEQEVGLIDDDETIWSYLRRNGFVVAILLLILLTASLVSVVLVSKTPIFDGPAPGLEPYPPNGVPDQGLSYMSVQEIKEKMEEYLTPPADLPELELIDEE